VSGVAEALLADRYELGRVIGRGGMGQVRLARDTRLGRDVAIKVLHLGGGSGADRERFEREARAAARVNHPNVVSVFDVGEQDDEVFIVMECLPGTTLADEIARAPLSAQRVAQVSTDLLAGLAAAHAQGVLHRDIKPSNVLFTEDGTAKLGDFGIAKVGDDTDLTEIGSIVGTAPYLAPERLHGEPATTASDLYALGVLLYEALSGARPFIGASPVAVAHAMSTTTPLAVEELRPDCPPALAAAIARAMRKDPAERFASAATMAAAITGATTEAMTGLAPSVGGAVAQTTPADALAASIPTASAAATLAPVTVPPTVPMPPTAAFPPDHRTRHAGPARAGLIAALVALVAGIVLVGVLAARPSTEPLSPPPTAVSTEPPPPTTAATTTTAAPPSSAPAVTVAPSHPSAAPVTAAPAKPGKGKGKDK